jgi:hypothetical protein
VHPREEMLEESERLDKEVEETTATLKLIPMLK